jgi:lipoprotein-anchoring transpeptidase ErfK/SrfK
MAGVAYIDGKYVAPDWAPPPVMRKNPHAPVQVIAGGSARNPMGIAALTLSGGEYAIHGTNQPESIGHFVSAGCIRMQNADVVDLYQRVAIGTPVVVTR